MKYDKEKKEEDFNKEAEKYANEMCAAYQGDETDHRICKFEFLNGAEYGYQYGKKEMADKMCNIIQGKLMQFTNEENERILPPLPLALFITEIYKEAMGE